MDADQAKSVIRHAQNDMAGLGPEPPPRPAPQKAKIGEGHAMAMIRLGAHELTQALASMPDSNIRPMEEPGVFGNPTPQIVTQEMGVAHDDYVRPAPSQDRGMTR